MWTEKEKTRHKTEELRQEGILKNRDILGFEPAMLIKYDIAQQQSVNCILSCMLDDDVSIRMTT